MLGVLPTGLLPGLKLHTEGCDLIFGTRTRRDGTRAEYSAHARCCAVTPNNTHSRHGTIPS